MSLEDESIHILRETAAQFENPVLLYSAGKDSSVLAHLAKKAFYPAKIPFPFLHVDTGLKFQEMYAFRDQFSLENGVKMIVYRSGFANLNSASTNSQNLVERGTYREPSYQEAHPSILGTQKCCALLKTKALLDALKTYEFDAAIGGARRDEEKSRAKERIFSFRSSSGYWDVRSQRVQFWDLYNGRKNKGENFRIFPLSNWTEISIWKYIQKEKISISPLYFAKNRNVVFKNGQYLLAKNEPYEVKKCRFRTLGCSPCTGAILSEADTIEKIVEEIATASYSERTTRVIDHDGDCSMEKKKREGYF